MEPSRFASHHQRHGGCERISSRSHGRSLCSSSEKSKPKLQQYCRPLPRRTARLQPVLIVRASFTYFLIFFVHPQSFFFSLTIFCFHAADFNRCLHKCTRTWTWMMRVWLIWKGLWWIYFRCCASRVSLSMWPMSKLLCRSWSVFLFLSLPSTFFFLLLKKEIGG